MRNPGDQEDADQPASGETAFQLPPAGRRSRRWLLPVLVVWGGMVMISLLSSRKGDWEAGLIGGVVGAIFGCIAMGPDFISWWLGRSKSAVQKGDLKDESSSLE
jgi:hypothetical protein